MIIGLAEAVATLLSIVAICWTVIIGVRMSLEHARKTQQMRQNHQYQMQMLINDRELLIIPTRAKSEVEVLDARTKSEVEVLDAKRRAARYSGK